MLAASGRRGRADTGAEVVPVEQRGPGSDVLIVGDTTSVVTRLGVWSFSSPCARMPLPTGGVRWPIPPASSAASPTDVAVCVRAH